MWLLLPPTPIFLVGFTFHFWWFLLSKHPSFPIALSQTVMPICYKPVYKYLSALHNLYYIILHNYCVTAWPPPYTYTMELAALVNWAKAIKGTVKGICVNLIGWVLRIFFKKRSVLKSPPANQPESHLSAIAAHFNNAFYKKQKKMQLPNRSKNMIPILTSMQGPSLAFSLWLSQRKHPWPPTQTCIIISVKKT